MARGPGAARAGPKLPGASAKAFDPSKAVLAPPRIKPASTRDYGKGGTPYSGSPDQGIRGAGIGYGGPPFGTT